MGKVLRITAVVGVLSLGSITPAFASGHDGGVVGGVLGLVGHLIHGLLGILF